MALARLFTFAALTLASVALARQPDKPVPPTPAPKPPAGDTQNEPPKLEPPDPNIKRELKDYNLGKDSLAIEGYDPVAYFPEGGGKAVKGKKEFAYTFRGVTYRFATRDNRERFKKNPTKYEPTYGGWCASAIADGGRKVEVDPTNFKVTDDRLFLFYKGLLQNAKDFWNKDEKKYTHDADDWWKKISSEEPRKPAEMKKDGPTPGSPTPNPSDTPGSSPKPKPRK